MESTVTNDAENHSVQNLSNNHTDLSSDLTKTWIEGLLPDADVERYNRIHSTLVELQTHLPALLKAPLTDDGGGRVYAKNIQLVVASQGASDGVSSPRGTLEDIELATSRQELLSLSNTLVLALEASMRAGNFLLSSGLGGTVSKPLSAPTVDCELVVREDDNFASIQVEWNVQVDSLLPSMDSVLPSAMAAPRQGISDTSPQTRIEGTSQLELDPSSGEITKHRILNVTINGIVQDSQAIGQSLATLRKSVRSLTSSLGGESRERTSQPSSPFSIFEQAGQELIQQLMDTAKIKNENVSLVPAPLYIVPAIQVSTNETNQTGIKLLMDTYCNDRLHCTDQTSEAVQAVPLPGSSQWTEYARKHQLIQTFVTNCIPVLSGEDPNPSTSIDALFTPNARLLSPDGSPLVKDASRVANYFRSLATWRKRTFGTWSLSNVTALSWQGKPLIRVDFTITAVLAGTKSTLIRGSDVFVLNEIDLDSSISTVKIDEVRQKELSIGGESTSSRQDALLLSKSLVTAVDAGGLRATNFDSILMDLLQRVGGSANTLAGKTSTPPVRSDIAAATVYRIMDNLFLAIPDLVDLSVEDSSVPAKEYLTENIEFMGYVGEVLIRGQSSYSRSLGLSIASLKAALRTGRVVSEKDPSVKVELTRERNVRLSFTLHLRIKPLPGLPIFDGDSLYGIGLGSTATGGLPFRIGIVSDYLLDAESGRVVAHQIKESRINGQLTPSDIVARWIKQRQQGGLEGRDSDSFFRGLVDTVDWMRSLSSDNDDGP